MTTLPQEADDALYTAILDRLDRNLWAINSSTLIGHAYVRGKREAADELFDLIKRYANEAVASRENIG